MSRAIKHTRRYLVRVNRYEHTAFTVGQALYPATVRVVPEKSKRFRPGSLPGTIVDGVAGKWYSLRLAEKMALEMLAVVDAVRAKDQK